MIKIKVSGKCFGDFTLRQTPGSKGIWDQCQFYLNDDTKEVDFWVVYGNIDRAQTALCPPENTIFMSGEPPAIKTYPDQYLAQFETVMICDPASKHPNIISTHGGAQWIYGLGFGPNREISALIDYDQLKAEPIVPKTKLISTICSKKATTDEHRSRLRLVEHLSNYFGGDMDIFGRGFHEVVDKREAIDDYRYVIVMENSCLDDYWSEKLADCYLGRAYPLYSGCTNLSKYFPENTATRIDTSKWEETVETIKATIGANQYETSYSDILKCRELILDKHNLFAVLSDFCQEKHKQGQVKQRITLRPKKKKRLGIF